MFQLLIIFKHVNQAGLPYSSSLLNTDSFQTSKSFITWIKN